MTPKEILDAEAADPCPFGLAKNTNEERAIAAMALRERSDFLISEGAAENLAYRVLIALRAAHFDWHQNGGERP